MGGVKRVSKFILFSIFKFNIIWNWNTNSFETDSKQIIEYHSYTCIHMYVYFIIYKIEKWFVFDALNV